MLKFQAVILAGLNCLASVAEINTNTRGYYNTTQVLNSLFAADVYDKRIRPYNEGPPLNISVYITVVSFGTIKEINMEFSLDIFFKQAWNDPRLVHELKKPILLSGSEKSNFWLPDTFFLNVKTAKFHHVPAANSRIAISPNGDVELSERLTVSASCRMDLRDYPLDTQTCLLEILSYSYDINDMDYHWDDAKALIILDDEMSEFELADDQTERKLVEYVIGTYTHLVAKFVFRRRLAYSFIQIYSPTFLIVVLSWLSFWISKDAVPARVALGITTVLTIVTLMGSLRNSVPKVSYIKAIDSYLIVSFIFVFGVLLEYVAVLMHSERKKAKARAKRSTSKDYSKAELEIETFHVKDSEVLPRSHSSYSLPPRPKSAHGLPLLSPSSYSLPQKSALRNSYPRQNVPGPAIQHSPYTTNPPRTTIIQCIPSFCLDLGSNNEVDIFDRIARIIFPLTFFIFNLAYYLSWISQRVNPNGRISFIMVPLYFIFWIFSVIFYRMAANEYKDTADVLNEITSPEKYSKFLRPFHKGSPLNVTIGVTVVHFVAVREVEEQFSLDMITWQTWNDPRLNHSLDEPIILPGESKKVIWLPDTFFLNVRSATIHDVITENSKVSITPGGVVTYSTRLTITAGCSMDLADYPLDEQHCDLELSTYAYTTNQLVYTWINGREAEKIKVSDERLSELTLVQTQSLYGFETYADGNHSKLIARFWFRRRLGYAFIQIYFPTMMLVVLSWLVFWIPQDAVPARVALGSTTVLSVVTFTGSFRGTFPKVSYIKAVDIYFIVSFAFVFSALMEYILVLLDTGVKQQRLRHVRNNVENCHDDVSFIEEKHHIDVSELHDVKVERPVEHPAAVARRGKSMKVLKGTAKKAKEYARYAFVRNEASSFDRVSRYLFPCSYCIFNLIYWCYYELASFGYDLPTK